MAWVAAGAISVAAGPLVGGVLIDAFGWQYDRPARPVPAAVPALWSRRQAGALIAVSILGSVLNTALPAGRLPAAFAMLGVAGIAGITLGLTTIRTRTTTRA